MFTNNFTKILIGLLLFSICAGSVYSQTNKDLFVDNQASTFPQNKVDKAIFKYRQNKHNVGAKKQIMQNPAIFNHSQNITDTYPGFISSEANIPDIKEFAISKTANNLYIGPQPDTLLINSDYIQNGDIIILGKGVLIVDGAKLTLSGQLYAQDQGQAVFRNNAHLHFNQVYVGQYFVWLIDSAKFEATDAIVDANGVMHFAQLNDNCTYIAKNTYFPDWTFRKVFNKSTLILEDVDHVGDIVVTDSCFVHFTRCDTLMPWLAAPGGSVFDIRFPEPDSVDHFEFSEAVPGLDGISYTFIVDTCCRCWWSLETWPGCFVKINNSEIRGSMLRIPGSDTVSVYDIADYNFHNDLLVPLADRHLEYIDTYVYWWNWYPMEQTVFYMDSCTFGEMIGRGESEIYATRSIHDGATISLSVEDSSFLSFMDGASYAYISSWGNATFLLMNTSVIPYWPYQSTNFAHDNSHLLAVNCYFVYEPLAMDAALVMFTAIDSPDVCIVESDVDIFGSAWIDAGPQNSVTFDRYKLYWSPAGDSLWTIIEESTNTVRRNIIGSWNTSGLSAGEYDLRLKILDSAGDSLTSFKPITLQSASGINKENILPGSFALLQNYPNPFNPQTTISYQLPLKTKIILKIYNMLGQEVRTLVNENKNAGNHSVVWDGKDNFGRQVSSGVYFYKLQLNKHLDISRQIKKLLLIK